MKKPQNLKKKALALLSVGALATGLTVAAPKPARADVDAIVEEANTMIEAVSTISSGAFIASLGVLGGVLALKYIKYNVFGS